MSTDQVQAGWYPDPLGLPQMRWWDGLGWTEHVSDARRPLIPQVVRTVASEAAPAEPSYAPTTVAEPEPAPEPVASTAAPAEPVSATVPASPEPAFAPEPARAAAEPARPAATASAPAALPAGEQAAPELGWSGAALALHSVQTAGVPMLIELEVVGHPPITIDTRHQAFEWQLALDWFPENPVGVRVSIELVDPKAPAPFELPGESLDALLWKIGNAAFPERLAPWLTPGERYQLERWPNVTSLQPDMDQIRQTAMLANGSFTVEELAWLSGRSTDSARRLINTLSLVGVLTITPPAAPGAAPEPTLMERKPTIDPVAREGNLFRRLRERLGL